MATQKESETAKILAGGLGPNLNDNQNADSVLDAVVEGNDSVLVEGKELGGVGINENLANDETENEKLANDEAEKEKLENDETEKEKLENDETESEKLVKGGSGNDFAVLETSKKGDDSDEKARNGAINEDKHNGVIEHSYCVGNFIWGKIKSSPWWPGRVNDPSDASDYAFRYKQPNRLLVVYFGDGSFSWCLPSELKPFTQNFEEMSNQSNLKSFVNAVDKALDEIGSLLELEMTCQCMPQAEVSMAVNGRIKEGVLVPKGDTCRLSLPNYDPKLVLFHLRDIARTFSVPSRLDIVVLTGWVSAFYRAKGGHRLSVYCEPKLIEGLEDKTRNHAVGGNCPVIADDELDQPRKQKSIAELMGENRRDNVGNNSDGVSETGAKGGRNEADCHDSVTTSKKRNSLSVKCSGENDRVEANGECEKNSVSRARKKSKFLSPPYTSP